MKVTIDTDAGVLVHQTEAGSHEMPLYTTEGFELLSELWVKVGWNQKYPYTFSWLGRPVIQLPEDLIRLQEVVWALRPDLIIETGVAHGGSAVFLAGLCRLAGRGRVVAVDVEIRPHNRAAIEDHSLSDLITLIEGDSVAPETVESVRRHVATEDTVLVILDSNHSKEHVEAELEAYSPLVSAGSYIVATDGVMREVWDTPRGDMSWASDHPASAAAAFLSRHEEFVLDPPSWSFNESDLVRPVTHWPDAWLRKR